MKNNKIVTHNICRHLYHHLIPLKSKERSKIWIYIYSDLYQKYYYEKSRGKIWKDDETTKMKGYDFRMKSTCQ